ncbi:ATP-binding protein [Niallia sp. Krafla_26]|uniref:ATP-binding protein n=1 Tax=Niallia sp. Krafla_26 TaxID=3064703 RepID=UPI003D18443B
MNIIERNALDQKVGSYVATELIEKLINKEPGHCAQITDLSPHVMEKSCEEILLHGAGRFEAYVLTSNDNRHQKPFEIHATKLVERRNLEQKVIVLFIPPNLRTAAEDSFDIATFEWISFDHVYLEMKKRLKIEAEQVMLDQDRILSLDNISNLIEKNWKLPGAMDWCLFYLSIIENKGTTESIGNSLPYLYLLPDEEILSATNQNTRILENIKAIETLRNVTKSIQNRVDELHTKDKNIKKKLLRLLRNYSHRVDFDQWVKETLTNDSLRETLDFQQWGVEKVMDNLEELKIEKIKGSALVHGQNGLELKLDGKKDFKIDYRSEPAPPLCEDWARVHVHLIDAEAEEAYTIVQTISTSKKKAANKVAQTQNVTAIQLSRLSDIDPGRYTIGIQAISHDGFILKESVAPEVFYIQGKQAAEDEPEEKKEIVGSSQEVFRAARISTMKEDEPFHFDANEFELNWGVAEEQPVPMQAQLSLYSKQQNTVYHLSTNYLLHQCHSMWLKHPEILGTLTYKHEEQAASEDFTVALKFEQQFDEMDYDSEAYKRFLRQRKRFFKAVTDLGPYHWEQILSFEESFLVEKAEKYLDAYKALLEELQEQSSEESIILMNRLRMTDLIEVQFDGSVFYLMTPSHPLKLAWSLQYEEVSEKWTNEAARLSERNRRLRDISTLLSEQTSIYYPFMVKDRHNSWYVNVDTVGNNWGIFVPVSKITDDAFLEHINEVLQIDRNYKRKSKFPYQRIKEKILQYLEKRPYLSVLTINVFEPDDGTEILSLFKQLFKSFQDSKYRIFQDLRINLRLFTDHEDLLNSLGKAIDEIMTSGEGKMVDEFQERITMEAQNPLFPVFSYSKHLTSDFTKDPIQFEANLSILSQLLKAEVGFFTDQEASQYRSSYFNGLSYELVSHTGGKNGNDQMSYWKKFISTKANYPGNKNAEAMLGLLESYSTLMMFDETDETGNLPGLMINMDADLKKHLENIHQVSDWVILIDEYLGVDFLDRPASGRDRYHLIDFAPDESLERNQVYVSTNKVSEIENMVKPVAQSIGLNMGEHTDRAVIDSLNAISGQLVMKLTSSSSQVKGALGMALARLYFREFNQASDDLQLIVIPLDAHKSWFVKERKSLSSQKMTDILAVACEPSKKEIAFNLIEVKWRNTLPGGDIVSATELRDNIVEQLDNSEQLLRKKFSSAEKSEPVYLQQAKELANILFYYLDRSYRFKSVTSDAYLKNKSFLLKLDDFTQPYQLTFKKHAFIFAMDQQGIDSRTLEGVGYHVIGKDKVEHYFQRAENEFDQDTEYFGELSKEELRRRASFFFTELVPNAVQETETPDSEKDGEEPLSGGEENIPDQDGANGEDDLIDIDLDLDGENDNETGVEIELDLDLDDDLDGDQEEWTDLDLDGNDSTESAETVREEEEQTCPPPAIFLGDHAISNQYGILGKLAANGDTIGIDLDGTLTISLFGVQGSGKSYTVGSILEMATKHFANANSLPAPLGSVVFHYSRSDAYEPEFTSIREPNQNEREVEKLRAEYGIEPEGIEDIVIITPVDRVEDRKRDFPSIEVLPLQFSTDELNVEDWQFLMNSEGNSAMYLRQLKSVLRVYRRNLTLSNIRRGIEEEDFDDRSRKLLERRLGFVEDYINDGIRIGETLKPGKVVIVDIRDEFIEENEALGLFMVLLRIFSDVKYEDRSFNKMIVFDEAHKYMNDPALMKNVVEVIREMRHKGVSMIIASQNPPSVPNEIIELSNLVVLHKFNAPLWLKHIQKTLTATAELTPAKLNQLKAGEAYIWASKSTHSMFEKEPQKVLLRPRITLHGGATKRATE